MHSIELLYLMASFASIVAMAPQIKQLFIAKESDELSLTTWIIWTTYQSIALVYSISLGLIIYSLVNLAWVSFYLVMLTLILKYRKKPVSKLSAVPVTVNSSMAPSYEPHPSR